MDTIKIFYADLRSFPVIVGQSWGVFWVYFQEKRIKKGRALKESPFLVEWGLVLGSITCALDENPLFLGIVALVEKQYLCTPKEHLYLTIYNFTIINSKLSTPN